MFRIVQLSDLHCGQQFFLSHLLERAIAEVNELGPDVVVVSGDLTSNGFKDEYALAREYLDRVECKAMVVIPGNHDSRNVGYVHFEELFGDRNSVLRLGDVTIVAVDSTEPDLDNGQIGRGRYRWIEEQFTAGAGSGDGEAGAVRPGDRAPAALGAGSGDGEAGAVRPGDRAPAALGAWSGGGEADAAGPGAVLRVFVLHHHLLPVPGTGRERNIVHDAGDTLEALQRAGVDLVLAGHKHVPYAWRLEDLFVVNAGTVSSSRLRGKGRPCYNVVEIDGTHVDVWRRYPFHGQERIIQFSADTKTFEKYTTRIEDEVRSA